MNAFQEEQYLLNEVMEGSLNCSHCSILYPIVDGIPRFIPNAFQLFPEFVKKYVKQLDQNGKGSQRLKDFSKTHGATQERFGFEWMNYPGAMDEDFDIFQYETQIDKGQWSGKLVLDGGCGMGRYSRVAHTFGALVIAMDLSGALVRLWDVAKNSERMHLVQGNIMNPPLAPETFDIVYSVGVIHHTPSARESFKQLSNLVKKGGVLSVWVYGAPGSLKNFRTNPLRADRAGLKPWIILVWFIVVVREWLSDLLRLFTIQMPHPLLYALCYPLAALGKIPLIKYLTFSVHPLWRVRLQENFDWLTPPYQSHHTKEELISWYEAEGFTAQKVLPHGFVPKPGVLGVKK